jgi:RNA polymerase sigma factor (sigma-70 family)
MKERLLDRARQGDEAAEKEIFEFLLARFTAFATRKIGGKDAADVAQEACLTIVKKYRDEKYTIGFEAWAYGVLKMTIRNFLRYRRYREKTSAPEFEIDRSGKTWEQEPDFELKRNLLDCLKQIYKRNPLYARSLNLRYQGYQTEAISEMLHVAPKNYYVLLSRGRKLLKECLETGRI